MPKQKTRSKNKIPVRRHFKRAWRLWPFKHMTAVALCVTAIVILLDSAIMVAFFEFSKNIDYYGVLLAGILFTSLLTSAAAIVMIFELAQVHNPLFVALVASVGAIIGDYIILRFFEDGLAHEIKLFARKLHLNKLVRLLKRRRSRGLITIAGIGVIASPLPDELGISLLDISHLSKPKLLLICYVSNLVGVSLVVAAGYSAIST